MAFTRDAHAIVGLGVTRQGRVPGVTSIDLRLEALRLALDDAGLRPQDVGGYVYQPGIVEMPTYGAAGDVPKLMGISPRLVWMVQTGGASAIACLLTACAVIDAGVCDYVAVGYGDTALSGATLVGEAGSSEADTMGAYGMYSPGADHALAARRHMHVFGTTKEQLGAVALTARAYANLREDAYMHDRPLTLEQYLDARPVADPLGKFDYCLVADGGCALVVTSAERARHHRRPVLISGVGFGHSTAEGFLGKPYEESAVGTAARTALRTAGVSVEDVDVAQIYDCFTITVLMALEGAGFCGLGEAGPFVEEGNLRLDGRIPTNTAGGELSWSYMQGFTPLTEAVRQLRGEGGPTQVRRAEVCLVTGHGGTTKELGHMEYADACAILRGA